MNADLDHGIEKNLDAALIQNKMHENVRYEVKSGVVTLSGGVNSEELRSSAEKVAAGVPNVQQVVNNLQIKNQKASSSRQEPDGGRTQECWLNEQFEFRCWPSRQT